MTPIESNITTTNRIRRSNFARPGATRSNAGLFQARALERFLDALRPVANSLTRPFNWLAVGVTLTAFTAYLSTLAPTITWRHGGADSGDLAAAVATLGIAHPPGYPTYVLLGRVWSWLPLGGDLAYRLNLLSATCAAVAAGLTVLTIAYLGQQQMKARLSLAIGAIMGGLFLAFAPLTWSQATIAEVYAPGLVVLSLLSWLLLKSAIPDVTWQPPSNSPQKGENQPTSPLLGGIEGGLFLAGLVAGLGFGVLPQIVLAAPGVLFLLYRRKGLGRRKRSGDRSNSIPSRSKRSEDCIERCDNCDDPGQIRTLRYALHCIPRYSGCYSFKHLSPLLLGVLIGLTVFAYLPLRASAHPLVNWGDPATPARFWAVVTAAQYHQYTTLLTPGEWFERLFASLFQLKQALSWAGLGLAGLGGYSLWRCHRAGLIYLLSLAGLTLLFQVSYPVIGNIVYLLPVVYSLALLAGLGAASLLTLAQSQLGSQWGRNGVMLLGFSFLITLGIRAVTIATQLDMSHDDQAARFGRQIFAALPPEAIVVSDRDETTFSLWYQQALGERPDVIVVDQRLLAYEWYQHHLEQRHPNLNLTNGLSSSSQPAYLLTGAPGEEKLSSFH